MKTVQELTQNIKRDFMTKVILRMRHETMTKNEAQQLAQSFLAIFPSTTVKELLHKLFLFSTESDIARQLFLKYAPAYYQEDEAIVLQMIPTYITHGQIDEAVTLLKGATYHG